MTPWPAACAAIALAAGCGSPPSVVRSSAQPGDAKADLHADDDPTVHGARLVPLEPGSAGQLWIAHGVRVREGPAGTVSSALERMPSSPSFPPVAVPERMGGGFLFGLGTRLWRSDTWLGTVRPIATLATPLRSIWVGLDRVYVTTVDGALGAVDAVTGAAVDRGPLPASPAITRFAALDAWHAVALADLRGPLLTSDAGATWRPVSLGPVVGDLGVTDARLQIDAMDGSRWEVRADGQLALVDPATPRVRVAEASSDPVLRLFGERPLAAAVEDGWPLSDGTAMVARDGALTRVRIADGSVVVTAPAFPLKPSRCHPLDLARPGDPGAFGFVCGEPGGATRIYRYAGREDRLVELRRFDAPREVLASGNGALAVRGACAPEAPRDGDDRGTWCLSPEGRGGDWRELRLAGDDVATARVVVLADGRVGLVRPPRGHDLTTARLTLTDGTKAVHLPLLMPELRADVARALRDGLWLDGFEERRPGVLGGWVDAGGPMLGVEIDVEGHVRVGELIREGAAPFVSGRWGFAWTASRRGFETTDGGMTWTKDLDLPEPLVKPRRVPARACGPVGCLAAGWIRIGWGAAPHPEPPAPARLRASARGAPSIDLECELGAPTAKAAPHVAPRFASARPASRAFPLLPSSAVPCRQELAAFAGQPPPQLPVELCGVQAEASPTSGPAQITAWGPKSGEWDADGRWSVAWLWPFGGRGDVRRSATTASPWSTREDAARFLGLVTSPVAFSLVAGDDAEHALLVGRPGLTPRNPVVLVLEADGTPAEVRWPGEPVPDVLAATRSAGRWFVATSAGLTEPAAIVVWAIDGAQARELTRLPRAMGVTPAAVHLARRSDGGSVGLVVDGQAGLDRAAAPRWIVALDADTGAASDPEPLFSLETGARPAMACTGDDDGWVLDVPYDGAVRFRDADGWSRVESPLARERLASDRGCLVRIEGGSDRDARALAHLSRGALLGPSLPVALRAAHERVALRCSMASRP